MVGHAKSHKNYYNNFNIEMLYKFIESLGPTVKIILTVVY